MEINYSCKALVLYGTNIGSTVGLKLTQDARNLMQLTEYHKEVFIGLLLGDGSLKTNKSKTVAYFKYNQSVIITDYVLHLFNTLSHYCTHLPNYHIRKYDTDYLQLYSRSLLALLELYELFYKDGVKILPQCFEDLLTPVVLAYWVIYDGSKAESGFYINTHSFSKAEHLLIQKALMSKLGLECNIHRHKTQYKIYITARSISKFKTLITLYFYKTIMYKLY